MAKYSEGFVLQRADGFFITIKGFVSGGFSSKFSYEYGTTHDVNHATIADNPRVHAKGAEDAGHGPCEWVPCVIKSEVIIAPAETDDS